jgi:hypothetical protein
MTFGFQLNPYFNYNLPFDIVEKKKPYQPEFR